MPFSATTDLLREAVALQRRGAVAEAAARYGEVLRADPGNADAYYYLGMMSCQAGQFDEGAEFARKALARDARHANAHILLGRALSARGLHDEAITSLQQAIALAPDLATAHSHLADVLSDIGRKTEAIDSYDRALALAPSVGDWFNRGLALHAVGRQVEALGSFERAIAAKPELARAHLERANVLWRLRRNDEALESVDRALARDPGLAEAWHSRGVILNDFGRYDGALVAYDKALALKFDFVEAWLGLGNALRSCRRYEEALAAYEKALVRKPELAEAWLGRGNVFVELKRYDDAFAAYDKALTLKPDLAEACLGRGSIFIKLKQYDFAFAAYDTALALKSDLKFAESDRLHAKLMMCDWINLDAEVSHLVSATRRQTLACDPIALLAIPSSAEDQLRCANCHSAERPFFPKLWHGEIYSHNRIRIAYLSADFHEHATAYLMAGLFEQHDRSRFEITAISFGPDQESDMRRRLKHSFEYFIDARLQSDQEIAEFIRSHEIDIAVDLKGFTEDARTNVFGRRPAPVQVNYLGYPGTMGAEYIDYILADRIVIPETQCDYYTEKVVWLPDCYQVNDEHRRISEDTPTRSKCSLPENAFVFCCFNNSYKITPDIFDVWMKLLKGIDNSVLWLIDDNSFAIANLAREANKRGVSSERLIFAPKIPLADHLARQRQANLFLDTIPYNAHTTASDALWAGLPVLTCLGLTFAGRVAASLLKAVGLDELITTSLEDYEILALKLAQDRALLTSLREKLARNRETYPLFNTARFARHIEAAYMTMWERQQKGATPQSFAVDPIN